MTEPQVWMLLAAFVTALFGMLSFVTLSVTRTIRSEMGSVRADLGAELGSLRAQLASNREVMDARFDAMNTKIDNLDRDVHLLMRREFGAES